MPSRARLQAAQAALLPGRALPVHPTLWQECPSDLAAVVARRAMPAPESLALAAQVVSPVAAVVAAGPEDFFRLVQAAREERALPARSYFRFISNHVSKASYFMGGRR